MMKRVDFNRRSTVPGGGYDRMWRYAVTNQQASSQAQLISMEAAQEVAASQYCSGECSNLSDDPE